MADAKEKASKLEAANSSQGKRLTIAVAAAEAARAELRAVQDALAASQGATKGLAAALRVRV